MAGTSYWSTIVDSVNEVAAEVAKTSGRKVVGVKTDITQEANLAVIDRALREVGGPLKFLGLVAAVLQKVGPSRRSNSRNGTRVQHQHPRQRNTHKHFAPVMKAAGGGSIVTVSSWFGRSGHGFFSAYCASKAALISLTHSAADELAGDKIRVNSVAPGNIATSMHFTALREEAEKRGITFEEMKKIEWDKIPLGRAADPAEIVAAIAFLASADGTYLTGTTIDVNGGVLFT